MFGVGPATKVYLAVGSADLRKGFEGLYGREKAGPMVAAIPLGGRNLPAPELSHPRLLGLRPARVGGLPAPTSPH
jgi:hypothetical protein